MGEGISWPLLREEGTGTAPAPGRVRLAAVQMDPRLGEAEINAAVSLQAIERAAGEGAALIGFPECSLTGYCVDSPEEAASVALEPDAEPLARIREACRRHEVTVAVGYLEKTEAGIANVVSLLSPSGPVARYAKAHLPFLGADRFTNPGRERFGVTETAGLRVGLQICYDASFPEATRLQALDGADLVLLPTNWPEEALAKAGWLPNTRAYENVIYFAAVNRVGEERGFRFRGMSRICDPTGATLVEGPLDECALLLADLDPARARTKRITRRENVYWVDRIGQRREDLYRIVRPGPEDPPA